IAAAEIAARLGIAAPPEAHEVARDLNGPLRRREQVQEQGHPAARDRRRGRGAEHLLDAYREDGLRPRNIVDARTPAARHRDIDRRLAVEALLLLPIEQRLERARQRNAPEVSPPRDAAQKRPE